MNRLYKVYTQTCAPCNKMKEVINKIVLEDYDVELYNIDARENPEFVGDYNIRSVPYFVLTDGDGNTIRTKGGMMDINEMIDFIEASDGT